MLTTAELQTVIGQTAYGPDGDKLGKIGQVWVDDQSARAEFVTVQTGWFGTHETFVPVRDATSTGDAVQMPFTKEQVKHAPPCESDGGHISAEDGRAIYDYYGVPYAGAATGPGDQSDTWEAAGVDKPYADPSDPLWRASATGAPSADDEDDSPGHTDPETR
ncbi:PRC-barrel domain-containing protein [Nocardioides speluncae]|uniref:PRC-barrel domain-containing protein n=1 Tax=Nocardioides speluncae TaxID=2670337 RepID=UPI000D695EB8|nr:PRC-barrel domain-containing protein [Nocardioides speluncae]